MKTAIILHGMPSKEEYFNPMSPAQSNKHWLPWIQRQLVLNEILAQTPEMPEPYTPVYEKWCPVFEQFAIDENTILIGHSCGGGFLLRWLSENKVKVGKVVLVAPWIDPAHELCTGFFDFKIDEKLPERTGGMTVFVSSDDDEVILQSVDQIQKKLKDIELKEFSSYGHFTLGDMKTDKFPELKDTLLGSLKKYQGLIIEESLKDKSVLNTFKILNTKVTDDENPEDRWHISMVEADETMIEKLAASLKPGKYYAHFWNEEKQMSVVFRDKIFSFNYNDQESWKPAVEYGISIGIPREQLDFSID